MSLIQLKLWDICGHSWSQAVVLQGQLSDDKKTTLMMKYWPNAYFSPANQEALFD